MKFQYINDYQYIDEIESYEEEILENIFKAADEWDRLTELSGPVHGPFSFF